LLAVDIRAAEGKALIEPDARGALLARVELGGAEAARRARNARGTVPLFVARGMFVAGVGRIVLVRVDHQATGESGEEDGS